MTVLNHTKSEGDVTAAKTVKSAERTLRILEILGAAKHPMTVTELFQTTGYPRSSLHQLLHTMTQLGWVDLADDGSTAAVGSRALLVGTSYLDRDPALHHGLDTIERVRGESGYTTHYARLDGASVIYLATRETRESHRATSRVGRQLPASATALGKALLAELSSAELAVLLPSELPQLTPNTVQSVKTLHRQLDETRLRGYALEREENTLGVACVGAAIPYRIPATDAISCSVPVEQATSEELDRVASILRTHTQDLAAKLRSEGIR